jgi:hypothetical protein
VPGLCRRSGCAMWRRARSTARSPPPAAAPAPIPSCGRSRPTRLRCAVVHGGQSWRGGGWRERGRDGAARRALRATGGAPTIRSTSGSRGPTAPPSATAACTSATRTFPFSHLQCSRTAPISVPCTQAIARAHRHTHVGRRCSREAARAATQVPAANGGRSCPPIVELAACSPMACDSRFVSAADQTGRLTRACVFAPASGRWVRPDLRTLLAAAWSPIGLRGTPARKRAAAVRAAIRSRSC